MTSSRRTSEETALSVLSQLNQTQSLIQGLLQEIRVGAAEQAGLKQELKQLRYNVSILSNIIRGGGGHSKPLLSEVEVLKHADRHLDKRISTVSDGLDQDIDEIANALSKQVDDLKIRFLETTSKLEERIDQEKKAAEKNHSLAMQLQHDNIKDVRLDKRQRLQIWSTVIIAFISLVASAISLFKD